MLTGDVVSKLNNLSTEKTLFFPVNTKSHWVLMELDTEVCHWTVYNTLTHTANGRDREFLKTQTVVCTIKLVS